jgi:hypothetical protein
MVMCLILDCCCGFQDLSQGLFIFAVFDVIINFLMIGFMMLAGSGNSLTGILILADIALAVGAKLQAGTVDCSACCHINCSKVAGVKSHLRQTV